MRGTLRIPKRHLFCVSRRYSFLGTVMPQGSIPAGSSLGGSHTGFRECLPDTGRKVAVESLQV